MSQPYLSLLEKGARRVPKKLARKAAMVSGLSPTTLPVEKSWHGVPAKQSDALASELQLLDIPALRT